MAVRELSTDKVLEIIQEVADEVIRPRFRSLDSDEIAEKGPGDLVTIADRESEERLTAILSGAYPDALIVGEEATASDPAIPHRLLGASHGWTIDPVDGTKNFVHGKRDYGVMVSEVIDGAAARAWIWQPEHQQAYVAERGAGVRHNGQPVTRRAPAPDSATWRGNSAREVIRSRPGDEVLAPIRPSALACAVDYPGMLVGDTDFLVYGRPRPWDHVPGILLVSELGGTAMMADGTPFEPGMDGFGLLVGISPQVTTTVREALGERLATRPSRHHAE